MTTYSRIYAGSLGHRVSLNVQLVRVGNDALLFRNCIEMSRSRSCKVPRSYESVPEEWQGLPSSLYPLVEVALNDPDSPWTDDDVRQIAGNLLKSPPSHSSWNDASTLLKIELLIMKGVREDACKDVQVFADNAMEFQAMCECENPDKEYKTVSADELLKEYAPLRKLKPAEWDFDIVKQFARYIGAVECIDAAISTEEGMGAWEEFGPVWESYLNSHPTIKALTDPVYVVVELAPGPTPPAVWPVYPAWPAGAPAPAPVPLLGSRYMFRFPHETKAAFWCGVIRNGIGNRCWTFNCSRPGVRY